MRFERITVQPGKMGGQPWMWTSTKLARSIQMGILFLGGSSCDSSWGFVGRHQYYERHRV